MTARGRSLGEAGASGEGGVNGVGWSEPEE